MTGSEPVRPSSGRRRSLVELGVVLGLFGVSLAFVSADQAVGGPPLEKLAILGRMAVLLLLATWFLRRSGQGWADVGLRRPRRWWLPLAGAILGLVLVSVAVAGLMAVVFPPLGLDRPERSAFESLEGDLPEYLFWALPVAWGSAAFGEEMLFRGFVQNRLEALFRGARGAVWLAILGHAALFGAFHLYQGPAGALMTGLTGVAMGATWLATGRNLWAPILVHGVLDFVSMTALFLGAPQG